MEKQRHTRIHTMTFFSMEVETLIQSKY